MSTNDNLNYKNLIAIVTGGCSGLGEATVNEFYNLGCKIACFDSNVARGEEMMKMYNSENFIFLETDLKDEDWIKASINRVIRKFGAIHILVNCAGINGVRPIEECDKSFVNNIFSVNFFGTYWMCKYATIQMKTQPYISSKNERGFIINVASEQAFEGSELRSVYASTKGAINSLTISLARELGEAGIRVNTIAPGLFLTPLSLDYRGVEGIKDYLYSIPLGRGGDPKEFAKCVVAICNNSYLTGSVIRLDGGVRGPFLRAKL